MKATDRLSGARLKVERAKDHLRDFERTGAALLQAHGYKIVIDDNPEAGQRQWKVRSRTPPSTAPTLDDLALIAGDAIHNTRSALDHLMSALVVANGRQPDSNTEFPIGRSQGHYQAIRARKTKGASKRAIGVLDTLKPYAGGNDGLFRIHQLDIVDKHRLLLALCVAQQNVIIDFGATMRQQFAGQPGLEWVQDVPDAPVALAPADPEVIREGTVVFACPLGDHTHDHTKITIAIALDEPGVSEREPLGPTLSQLVGLAEQVIATCAPLIEGTH